MAPYIFQRGETISLALDALSGDPNSVTAIAAKLKVVPPGRTTAPASAPIAASFTITNRAASGADPAGWTLAIPAVTSATLTPGAYLADARLDVGGGVIVTESVAIRLRESVSVWQ